MYEDDPSCVRYKSTKLVSSVLRSFTSIDAKNASVLLILVDIIVEVVAVATVVFIPDKFMKPIDWVPIPVKFLLNEVWSILIS